ncbi:GNAT family N-acetyltransferase [Pelagibius sp. Alg239-R121]|uniref:GNAT family N-acetyltransferase n=1 Tax=Pelagibius sp. Alg239-R121 TaxID=2993448 RepID=UPI0024A6759A|nr:GNAT family N-acetyltransferase [Pelagibius sp. Alg239-R121]
MKQWNCRLAKMTDAKALVTLQVDCTHKLGFAFYSDFELDSYIREVGTLDISLIHRRTYYVVEHEGHIVGCGGWSDRPPHYGKYLDSEELAVHHPKIRAFFVHPDYARQGIGSALMAYVEADIRRAGYDCVELTAMLSGVTFYRSLGYRKTGNAAVELSNGAYLPAIEMGKRFNEEEITAPTL